MFKPGQIVYVKVSTGYIPCTIISRKGIYYTVKSYGTGFGCNENRIITIEQYEEMLNNNPIQTNYRPPDLH